MPSAVEIINALLKTVKENTQTQERLINKVEESVKDISEIKANIKTVNDIYTRLEGAPITELYKELRDVSEEIIKIPEITADKIEKAVKSTQEVHKQCKADVNKSVLITIDRTDAIGDEIAALGKNFNEYFIEKTKSRTERIKQWTQILGLLTALAMLTYKLFWG